MWIFKIIELGTKLSSVISYLEIIGIREKFVSNFK